MIIFSIRICQKNGLIAKSKNMLLIFILNWLKPIIIYQIKTKYHYMNVEASRLVDFFESARKITMYYFNKLKDVGYDRVPVADGVALNSAKWIMAHLVWTENFLLLQGLGGEQVTFPWFSKVAFGTPLAKPEELPPIEEILEGMKQVHEAAIAHLQTLTDEQLLEPNLNGMSFSGDNSKRFLVLHACRHESGHAGQLGWHCKIAGIKTI